MTTPRADTLELGERIKARRLAGGLTYSALARLSGISRSYLYQIEACSSEVTVTKLVCLCQALETDPNTLLGWPQ